MLRVIIVAELAGCLSFLKGTCLGGGSVFVGSANIKGLVTTAAAESREHVGTEYLNEISQMGNIVNVR